MNQGGRAKYPLGFGGFHGLDDLWDSRDSATVWQQTSSGCLKKKQILDSASAEGFRSLALMEREGSKRGIHRKRERGERRERSNNRWGWRLRTGGRGAPNGR